MSSSEETPQPEERAATKADPIYRSRQAALRHRIAGVEAELRELRAELSGLPEVRARRRWLILGSLAALASIAVASFVVLWMRRSPDPFTFTPVQHNGGWMLTFQFDTPVRCIEVTVEGRDGRHDRVDCTTMPTAPQVAQAGLTFDQARTPSKVTMEYEVRGARRHVTTSFDPRAAQVAQARHLLTSVGQWVEGRDFNGKRLLYFSHLLSYAQVLTEIRYGFDDEPRDRTVRFRQRENLGILEDDEIYCEIPFSVHSVSVELTFVDGTTMTRSVPVMPHGGDK